MIISWNWALPQWPLFLSSIYNRCFISFDFCQNFSDENTYIHILMVQDDSERTGCFQITHLSNTWSIHHLFIPPLLWGMKKHMCLVISTTNNDVLQRVWDELDYRIDRCHVILLNLCKITEITVSTIWLSLHIQT